MISFGHRLAASSAIYLLLSVLYFLTNSWADPNTALSVYSPLENLIPLVPLSVYPYLLGYATLLVCPVLLVTDAKKFLQLTDKLLIVIIASCLFFAIVPTTTWRPQIAVTGWATWSLNFLYFLDSPNNCFPSLHISLCVVISGFLHCENGNKTWPLVIAGLVAISTLLTKQHALIDIVGGGLLGLALLKLNKTEFE